MGDKPKPAGGRAWRQAVEDERRKAAADLKSKGTPKTYEDLLATYSLIQTLCHRYPDPEDRGSYLDPDLSSDQRTTGQQSLDSAYNWLAATLEDSKLEKHFRYSHVPGIDYPSAQWAALAALDGARTLRRTAATGIPDSAWNDRLREIGRAQPYVKALLGQAPALPTDRDKAISLILLGGMAIPVAAAAVIAIPEALAALGTASLHAAFAIPGGATAMALVVEHYAVAEIIVYFAVGTIVNIKEAGGIEGFAAQLQTPEGAFQTAYDIVFFVVQVRGARGDGYVGVRGRITNRKPGSLSIRIEKVEEIHPPTPAPVKLGPVNLRQMLKPIGVKVASRGTVPQTLKTQVASSIAGARQKFGERLNCNGHQDHHMANLPSTLKKERVDSPIGGEHCIVRIEHEGKWYTIDSSAKQFIKDPPAHPTGIVDIQKIQDLDRKKPFLKLMEAIDNGVFTLEQHDEFAKLCGSLGF